jgi:hypothetical protein
MNEAKSEDRRFRIAVNPQSGEVTATQIAGERFALEEAGYNLVPPAPIEAVEVAPSLEPEDTGRTYEVFLDLEHHPRHNEDQSKHVRQCWKLVNTCRPREMIVACLRELADQVEAGKYG